MSLARRRFSHSPIWQIPRQLPRHAADLAAHCANVAVRFVQCQPAKSKVNVLVLNCREGEFALLFLLALNELLASESRSVVCILSDRCREKALACRSYFQRRILENFKLRLEFAVFDPEYDTECIFFSGRQYQPGPTVLIAESLLLDAMRFDIFCVRDGTLHEGLVHIDSCRQWEPDLDDVEFVNRSRLKLHYRRYDLSKTAYYTGEHFRLNLMLEQFEKEGVQNFCVPVGAVDTLLNILHLTNGNFMLIAIDDCPLLLQFPCEVVRKSLKPTVSTLGGEVFTNRSSLNTALICFGSISSSVISSFNLVFGDGSIPNLQSFMGSFNLPSALWLLEHSNFDPEVFIRLEKQFNYSMIAEEYKDRLHVALMNVFERRFATGNSHCLAVGRLLMDMKLWDHACKVWQSIISESPSDTLSASYFLAVCYRNLGRLDAALKTIEKSLEQRPFDENFRQLKLELMMVK